MSNRPLWRLLPVAAVPGIPNLLVSTTFTDQSYSVHLTDLANVWIESMDKKPIVKRGLVEDTSIDPTDGPDQIRRMLELLRAAFDTEDPEHHNTSMSLAKGDDDDSLTIHITCVLPKPLKPFRWPMHLKKCPQSTVATELVLPLVQAHHARAKEIDHLIATIREKDSVIAKLVDKLEATGTGLEHVFNALSGKRKVTRAVAEGRVKGLAPFTEADFRSGATEAQSNAGPVDVSTLLQSVFGGTGLKYASGLDVVASPGLNDWWTQLGKGKSVVLVDRAKETRAETPPPPQRSDSKAGDEDDDDFQVQATPPGLLSARKRDTNTRPVAVDDDETSDGEDASEIPDSLPRPPAKKTSPGKAPGSRLGAIGKKKHQPSPPAPLRSPTPPEPSAVRSEGPKDDDAGSETASDPEDKMDASPPPASPPKPAPKRGGLGRIGGKHRATTPVVEPPRSPSPTAPETEPSPAPRRRKLGVIGNKAPRTGTATPAEDTDDERRGRFDTQSAESKGAPRETSQERADRKRAELQRELDKKAAAGPSKKKRKF
ncbi:XRCC4-like factor-domain-containing protein [Diplogelasinospora grovesii]|uniref:Non-homologous end-joining factor 1 n=1 Tax=Diplogelasinospora grovesii TaxID=303347 RepID=A0AAN6S2T3_9PEZI|nr:XRCC4-like factor-domain-containing protein [Diplogelasinospora grovesii]